MPEVVPLPDRERDSLAVARLLACARAQPVDDAVDPELARRDEKISALGVPRIAGDAAEGASHGRAVGLGDADRPSVSTLLVLALLGRWSGGAGGGEGDENQESVAHASDTRFVREHSGRNTGPNPRLPDHRMADSIHVHPVAFDNLAPVLELLDSGVAIHRDDRLDVAVARLAMAPGPRASVLINVLLLLGSRVQLVWSDALALAEWIEADVAERRNLGPHTAKAAIAKAGGLSVEEVAALLGWSRATVVTQTRAAGDALTDADWGDLRTAASLRDASAMLPGSAEPVGHVVEFERVATTIGHTVVPS